MILYLYCASYIITGSEALEPLSLSQDWECFATTASSTNPNCTFMSIEGIHNLIHLYTGGHLPNPNNTVPGFMSVLEVSLDRSKGILTLCQWTRSFLIGEFHMGLNPHYSHSPLRLLVLTPSSFCIMPMLTDWLPCGR